MGAPSATKLSLGSLHSHSEDHLCPVPAVQGLGHMAEGSDKDLGTLDSRVKSKSMVLRASCPTEKCYPQPAAHSLPPAPAPCRTPGHTVPAAGSRPGST